MVGVSWPPFALLARKRRANLARVAGFRGFRRVPHSTRVLLGGSAWRLGVQGLDVQWRNRHEPTLEVWEKSTMAELADDPLLKRLAPLVARVMHMQLVAESKGQQTIKLPADVKHIHEVYCNSFELQGGLDGLETTLAFLRECLRPEEWLDVKRYQYHYENYIIRSVGFIDRMHLFAGKAMLMSAKKLKDIRANKHVEDHARRYNTAVLSQLRLARSRVAPDRSRRNLVVHVERFSNRILAMAQMPSLLSDSTLAEQVRAHVNDAIQVELVAAGQVVNDLRATTEALVDALESELGCLVEVAEAWLKTLSPSVEQEVQ